MWTYADARPILALTVMRLYSSKIPTIVEAVVRSLVDTKDLATHRVLFGRVRAVRIGDSLSPLIYYNRAYRLL